MRTGCRMDLGTIQVPGEDGREEQEENKRRTRGE
jgi:hypothetical protein